MLLSTEELHTLQLELPLLLNYLAMLYLRYVLFIVSLNTWAGSCNWGLLVGVSAFMMQMNNITLGFYISLGSRSLPISKWERPIKFLRSQACPIMPNPQDPIISLTPYSTERHVVELNRLARGNISHVHLTLVSRDSVK